MRSNRNDLPKDRLFPREGANKRERGEAECCYTNVSVGGSEHKIRLVCWQDNKPVHILISVETDLSEVERIFKRNGRYTHKGPIPMSTVINNYNRSMGGAYLHDQN